MKFITTTIEIGMDEFKAFQAETLGGEDNPEWTGEMVAKVAITQRELDQLLNNCWASREYKEAV